ncbi:hypothetical protein NPIL_174871 [Nephila pilipes]|uniref:Uncharacterized protein n=1 Tax=Nephila pilipes TaxID=299642 RepID=A0A8X6P0F2_NEPPI|nr:hypothetical protein NPIL_174871 [Nephila pilipes]
MKGKLLEQDECVCSSEKWCKYWSFPELILSQVYHGEADFCKTDSSRARRQSVDERDRLRLIHIVTEDKWAIVKWMVPSLVQKKVLEARHPK